MADLTEEGNIGNIDGYDVELLKDFVAESMEFLDRSEQALLSLETNPEDTEAINTAFRAFHTVKGTSAFVGLPAVTELAHKAENLLSRVRDREIQCAGRYADLAFRSADMLKALIKAAESGQPSESMNRFPGYAELLQTLTNPDTTLPEGTLREAKGEDAAVDSEPLQAEGRVRTEGRRSDSSSIRVNTEKLDRLVDIVGELVIAESMVAHDA
jgi:two-component system, chemotaxis family, sensor kinase CheA